MSAYGHRIQHIGPDHFRLYWAVDHKHVGSRLRHPRVARRDTDRKGAERFAKRHGVSMPAETQP